MAATADPALRLDPDALRRVWVTGVGNSAAHARYLADVLDREVGVPARFVGMGALAADAGERGQDTLVVFSQGLSPNARFALEAPRRWGALVLVTATAPQGGTRPDHREKAALLDALRKAGGALVRIPAEEEYGTLIRVSGPMLAYAAALAVARSIAALLGRSATSLRLDVDRIEAAWARARAETERAFPTDRRLPFARGLALLCSGGYGERAQGWRHKVLEGMGLPWPPLWDLLEFAHGPYQHHASEPVALLALTRADAPEEERLLGACRRMLGAEAVRLHRLPARLPGALAVFEHEAQGNALLLRWLAQERRDPRAWPGQGRDAPLYAERPRVSPAVMRE